MSQPAEYIYNEGSLIGYNYNKPIGDVVLLDGTVAITRAVFNECKEITSVSLPSTVRHIGNYAFKGCSSLGSITSYIPADKLFELDATVFMNVDKSAITLYVPHGAAEAYSSIAGWNEFENIVELAPTVFNLNVTYCGYSTLYLDYDVEIPAGVTCYTVSGITEGAAILTEVDGFIPANTGVIVEAEEGVYDFAPSIAATSVKGNMLCGTVVDTDITAEAYVLGVVDGVVALYKALMTDGKFTNNANTAYLPANALVVGSAGPPSLSFRFPGTTAVDEVKGENGKVKAVFDLTGRKVEFVTAPGVYVINNRKVLVK